MHVYLYMTNNYIYIYDHVCIWHHMTLYYDIIWFSLILSLSLSIVLSKSSVTDWRQAKGPAPETVCQPASSVASRVMSLHQAAGKIESYDCICHAYVHTYIYVILYICVQTNIDTSWVSVEPVLAWKQSAAMGGTCSETEWLKSTVHNVMTKKHPPKTIDFSKLLRKEW